MKYKWMKKFYNLGCRMPSDLFLMLNICSGFLQEKKKKKAKSLTVAMPSCKQSALGRWGNY